MGNGCVVDANGQPVIEGFCRKTRERRAVDELIGIAKGVVADGVVNQMEAEFLCRWLDENMHHALDVWPVNAVNRKVREMLSDGVIDGDERQALFDLLSQCVGGQPVAENVASFATSLPFDDPLPAVTFEGHSFCLTGCFAMGPRKDCERQVVERGGIIYPSIKKDLNFLVVGTIGSRDWLHSTHGSKIMKAVEYRDKGRGIAIVGEDHWANFL
jgi:NAD-dependent DNA ligase